MTYSNVSDEKLTLKNLNGGIVLEGANKQQVFDFISRWPAREYKVEWDNSSCNSTVFYHKCSYEL